MILEVKYINKLNLIIILLCAVFGLNSFVSKKNNYIFLDNEKKFAISNKLTSSVSKIKNIDSSHWFGSSRSCQTINFRQDIYKPVRCKRGTIVELGSCQEFITGEIKLTKFKINKNEFNSLFKDSLASFLDSITISGTQRKITFKKTDKILLIEEYDTLQKKIFNIYINNLDCFVIECKAINKFSKKDNGFNYRADFETMNLNEFTKPIYFLYEQYSPTRHKHNEKQPYISSGKNFNF